MGIRRKFCEWISGVRRSNMLSHRVNCGARRLRTVRFRFSHDYLLKVPPWRGSAPDRDSGFERASSRLAVALDGHAGFALKLLELVDHDGAVLVNQSRPP